MFKCPSHEGRGVSPGIPGAFIPLPPSIRSRCVNLKTSWENPSDLSEQATWTYLIKTVEKEDMVTSFLICDAQLNDDNITQEIERLMILNIPALLRLFSQQLLGCLQDINSSGAKVPFIIVRVRNTV